MRCRASNKRIISSCVPITHLGVPRSGIDDGLEHLAPDGVEHAAQVGRVQAGVQQHQVGVQVGDDVVGRHQVTVRLRELGQVGVHLRHHLKERGCLIRQDVAIAQQNRFN